MKLITMNITQFVLKNVKLILNLHIIVLPILCVVTSESIWRGGIISFTLWSIHNVNAFFLCFLSYFVIFNFWALLGYRFSIITRWLTFVIINLVSIACRIKLDTRNQVLELKDMFLIKEALVMGPKYLINNHGTVLSLIIVALLCIIFLTFALPNRYDSYHSISIGIISIILGFIIVTGFPYNVENELHVSAVTNDSNKNAEINGLINSFYLASKTGSLLQTYDRGSIENVVQKLQRVSIQSPYSQNHIKPNIIFILGESTINPNSFNKSVFKKPVVPNLERIMQVSIMSGTFVSPVFGGGTINPEYEALTGINSLYIQDNTTVYDACLKDNKNFVTSVPNMFKKEGYKTAAFHTFYGDFYGRNKVFPQCMGFNLFEASDKLVNKSMINSKQYLPNSILYKRTLDQLRNTNQPDFIYLATMRTHGPYPSSSYNTFVKPNSPLLNKTERGELEYYSQVSNEADRDLGAFINQLKKLKEPTIVLFFGDHFPAIGNNEQIYKDLKFTKDNQSIGDNLKLHSPPFFIWSNDDKVFKHHQVYRQVSLPFLSAKVVELSGIKPNLIFKWLIANQNNMTYPNPYTGNSKSEELKFSDYNLLMYDTLKGKNYAQSFGEN